MNLDKMTCVVTGAESSIGKAIINSLLEKGVKLIAVSHGQTSSLVKTDPNLYTVKGDLVNIASVRTIVETILDNIGQIHVWINVVGGFQMGQPVEDSSIEQWKKMLSVNFITTLNCCQTVLPSMKEQRFGRIINFGSHPGEEGLAMAAPYAVSKAAVHVLTKTITEENKEFNIVACAILPGIVDTPQNRKALPDEDWKQWLQPTDIAQKISELLADDKLVDVQKPDSVLIPIEPKKEGEAEKPAEPEILSVFDSDTGTETETISTEAVDEKSGKEEPEEAEPLSSDEAVEVADEKTEESPLEAEGQPEEESQPIQEESPALNPKLATFTLVGVLKKQKLYQQALDVLTVLEQKGKDPERIQKEKQEIIGLLEPEIEPQESKEVPPAEEDQPEISETRIESQTIDPRMATFSTMAYLKSRGSYRQALEMLDALEKKGENPERIQQEKQEILQMLEISAEKTEVSEPDVLEEQMSEDVPGGEEESESEISPEAVEEETDVGTPPQILEPSETGDTEIEQSETILETETVMETEPEISPEPDTVEQEEEFSTVEQPEEEAGPQELENLEREEDEEEGTSDLEEPAEEISKEAVSPKQPPDKKKLTSRILTPLLLVTLIIVSGFVLWNWLKPERSSTAPVSSEKKNFQSEDLTGSTTTKTSKPLIGLKETSTIETEKQSSIDNLVGRPLVGDTIMAQEVDETQGIAAVDTIVDRQIVTELVTDTITGEKPSKMNQQNLINDQTAAGTEKAQMALKTEIDTLTEQVTETEETSTGDPRSLFNKAQYKEAAKVWQNEKSKTPERYTIALEFACKISTIRNAYEHVNRSEDFFLLPYNLPDRNCFIFCWGDFPDQATAEEQFWKVPEWFEDNGAHPVIRPYYKLIRDLEIDKSVGEKPSQKNLTSPVSSKTTGKSVKSGIVTQPVLTPEADQTTKQEMISGKTSKGDPWQFFNKAQYREAAEAWRKEKITNLERYTIVLEFACEREKIRNVYDILDQSEDFFILTYNLPDRDCFILSWGDFPDQAAAEEQFQKVPKWFEDNGAHPIVRPFFYLIR